MTPAIEVLRSLIAEVQADLAAAEINKNRSDEPDGPYIRGMRHGAEDARNSVLMQLRMRLSWAEQAAKMEVES